MCKQHKIMEYHNLDTFTSPWPTPRLCRLLLRGNMTAMRAAVITAAVLALTVAARADEATRTASRNTPDAAPLLDWSHAHRVFPYIEACVHAGDVEAVPTPPPIWVADVQGARVTVRWLGRAMGRGDALLPLQTATPLAADPSHAAPDAVIDLVTLARQAVAAALADVHLGLADRNQRARQRAEDPAAFKPWTLADLRPLRVDLQLARGPQPIRLPADAPPQALFRQFAPGHHGLMTPAADTEAAKPPSAPGSAGGSQAGAPLAAINPEAVVWPATALAMNQSPPAQVRQLLRAAGTPPLHLNEQIDRVARPGGLPLARFEVIHMVRVEDDQPPLRLVRGNVPLPPTDVTGQTLAEMAQQMLQFLLRRQTADGDFLGAYHPTSDQFEPARAPVEEVALAAYVLARRADMIDDAQGQAPGRIHTAAQNALRFLNLRYTPSNAPDEPAAQALTLLAIMAMDDGIDRQIERDVLGQRLAARFTDSRGKAADAAQPEAAPRQALLALALAVFASQPDAPPAAGQAARQAAADLIQRIDAAHIVAALPWYAMALQAASCLPAEGEPARDGDAVISPADVRRRLGALLEQLRPLQIAADASMDLDDVVGGFDLLAAAEPASRIGQAAPVADWRTANILALMALDLRAAATEEAAVENPEHRQTLVRQVVDCGRAARFLHQLMFTSQNAYYVRSLPDVLGGIRPALWDNRLTTAPTAMTLLAVTELQQALDILALP